MEYPRLSTQLKMVSRSLAATKIQRWFRSLQKSRVASSASFSILIETKKKEINDKLRASRRKRETRRSSHIPKILRGSLASLSSYNQALLEHPLEMTSSPSLYKSDADSQISGDTGKTRYDSGSDYSQKELLYFSMPMDKRKVNSPNFDKIGDIMDFKNSNTISDKENCSTNNGAKIKKEDSSFMESENKGLMNLSLQDLIDLMQDLDGDNVFQIDASENSTSKNKESGYSSFHSYPKDSAIETSRRSLIHEFLDRIDSGSEEKSSLALLNLNNDMVYVNNMKEPRSASDRMISLSIELEQKNKTIHMLLDALNISRKKNGDLSKILQAEMDGQLGRQKQEHDFTVEKNLAFIDELLLDKKVLTAKCDQLKLDLIQENTYFEKRLHALEERHKHETDKLQSKISNIDTLNRKKLRHENNEETNNMMRNTEPDIQDMISNHNSQIQRLNAQHQEELTKTENQAKKLQNFELKTLNEKLKLAETTIISLETAVLNNSKSDFFANDEQQSVKIENMRKELENSFNAKVQMLNITHESELQEISRKQKKTVRTLKARMEEEKLLWEKCLYEEQTMAKIKAKEELKSRFSNSRTGELEVIISQLNKEVGLLNCRNIKELTEQRRMLQKQYEADLRNNIRSYEDMKQKFMEAKRQNSYLEAENSMLNVAARQNHVDMERMNNVLKKHNEDSKSTREQILEQFKNEVKSLEEKNNELKVEVAALRERYGNGSKEFETKLKEFQETKENELDKIHQRVKTIISKKDSKIEELNKQMKSTQNRADHLEELLDKQREELFMK